MTQTSIAGGNVGRHQLPRQEGFDSIDCRNAWLARYPLNRWVTPGFLITRPFLKRIVLRADDAPSRLAEHPGPRLGRRYGRR